MKKNWVFLILIHASALGSSSIEEDFKKIILEAYDKNPSGFFEHERGKDISVSKNIPKISLKVISRDSANLISSIAQGFDSIFDIDHISIKEAQAYGKVKFEFIDYKNDKRSLSCQISKYTKCGLAKIYACSSSTGVRVALTNSVDFEYIYDESLAANEECFPKKIADRRRINSKIEKGNKRHNRLKDSSGASKAINKN